MGEQSPLLNQLTISNPIFCRYCYSSDDVVDLISPCKCTGTARYIHQTCLLKWINMNESVSGKFTCEICHTEYIIEYRIVWENLFTRAVIKHMLIRVIIPVCLMAVLMTPTLYYLVKMLVAMGWPMPVIIALIIGFVLAVCFVLGTIVQSEFNGVELRGILTQQTIRSIQSPEYILPV